jgi:hypothetical protein
MVAGTPLLVVALGLMIRRFGPVDGLADEQMGVRSGGPSMPGARIARWRLGAAATSRPARQRAILSTRSNLRQLAGT